MDMPDSDKKMKPTTSGPQDEKIGVAEFIWLALKDIPRLMRTMTFAVWVIGILAVFTLVGTILPQEHLSSDPIKFGQGYQNLFDVDPDDGKSTIGEFIYYNLVVKLELHRIFETGLYYTLLIVLTISSVLCAWDRLRISRKLLKLTKPKVRPESVEKMPYSSGGVVESEIDEVNHRVTETMKRHGFQVFAESDDNGTRWFFVRKNAFRHIVTVVFHFALVFILIGCTIGDERALGYEGRILIREGGAEPVGSKAHSIAQEAGEEFRPDYNELIELVEYENIYREEDFPGIDPDTGFPINYKMGPSDYVSHLRIIRPNPDGEDEILAERTIEVNFPLRYGGVAYYQSSVDTLLHFTVSAPGQEDVPVITPLNRPITIPYLNISSGISPYDIIGGYWEASDGTRTVLPYTIRLVDLSSLTSGFGDEVETLGYVSEDRPLVIDGVTIALDQVDEYTILSYVCDPGVPIVYFGGFLLIIGLSIALYMPYRTGRIILTREGQKTRYVVGSNSGEFPELLEKALGKDRGS